MSFDVHWGNATETTALQVHEVPVTIDDLPAPLEGLRLAVLSDLHYGRFCTPAYAQRIVQITLGLAPDIVCVLGDMVNNGRSQTAPCAEILSRLHAPHGVFGCIGNHEFFGGAQQCTDAYRAAGVDMLTNAHRVITIGDSRLVIAGVDDHRYGKPDATAALAGAPADCPTILLSHNPDQAMCLDGRLRIDLMLCGHTHGGQIRLRGKPLVAHIRHPRFAAGLVEGPCCRVYTCRGLGMTGFPLRINCPAELPVIRLEPGC